MPTGNIAIHLQLCDFGIFGRELTFFGGDFGILGIEPRPKMQTASEKCADQRPGDQSDPSGGHDKRGGQLAANIEEIEGAEEKPDTCTQGANEGGPDESEQYLICSGVRWCL
jgi:hypothetical protein